MPIPGKLLTTAMAVMPHRDVDRALQSALSLDIPFWPQLPRLSYYEDMYVQANDQAANRGKKRLPRPIYSPRVRLAPHQPVNGKR